MRYLTGTLSEAVESAIRSEAKRDAETAVQEGATAPWGDGETLPDVEDLLRALPRALRPDPDDSGARQQYALCYDRAFRDAIDELAPAASDAE